jgi:DNA replication and repair protein RecF
LSLRNWRNYAESELPFPPGTTLLIGPNGQGKTNMVEAIGYLATLSSHRVSDDAALVKQHEDSAVIRARLEHEHRTLVVDMVVNRKGANRVQLGGAPAKARDLPAQLDVIQFAPEDLSLVRGDPTGRRRFLDELLVHRSPRMAGALSDYDRALRQRNTLLKSIRSVDVSGAQSRTLDAWDERLATAGSEILAGRVALVCELDGPVREAYQAVAGSEHVTGLALRMSIDGIQADDANIADVDGATSPLARSREELTTRFLAALQASRRAELERGLTLIGPHRDELQLGLNGLPARGYASHGESWSYALALRLGSARLLRTTSLHGDPVLILDDVFAELDEGRRARLATAVADFEQILVTAAVEADVPAALSGHRVRVNAGRLFSGTDSE